MPEISRIFDYKICVFGNDHAPPHFHIVKNGNSIVRFRIDNFEAMDKHKLKGAQLDAIKAYWSTNKALLLTNFCTFNPKACESPS